jgi:Golgi phosphoprotein 3 (GPP34)
MRMVDGVDWLSDDLLLLTIVCSRGRVGRVYTIGYALMAAELIRLAARERIEICADQIVLSGAESTGDAELDAALAGIAEWASPPRPDDWVARPRLRIHGEYLERLAAGGVVRAQTRLSARRWRVIDAARLAEARQRLDLVAGSAGAVGLEQAAYAGLACVIGLDRQLYRGRARRSERDRLREIARGRRPASLEAGGDAAGGPGALAGWPGSADPAQARLSAATRAAIDAATRAAARAAAQGVAEATARDASPWYAG